MIDEKFGVPLSPPTSPRMSETSAKIHEYQWQQQRTMMTTADAAASFGPHVEDAGSFSNVPAQDSTVVEQTQRMRPPLRIHKSFPYSLSPSSHSQDDAVQNNSSTSGLEGFNEKVLSQAPQSTGSAILQQATFGGSAPTSPVAQLTPNTPKAKQDDLSMEDEEMDFDVTEEEEEGEAERPPMTAAELRAHKRKMKRFRLTHNQTRFLMSEFARQAHPDAAHRERLSREIPGLSPRQVQVWFQNRRAKLKRLTTDDRERMMRSRALPANFDMTQALHAPFGAPTPNLSTPVATPGPLAPHVHSNGLRPLTLDTLRRAPDYVPFNQNYANSSGVTPALGALAFTPPQSATDTMSPGSAATNASPFGLHTQESPRRHPFGTALGIQTSYVGHGPQMPRLNLYERVARPVGETAGSPLRTSMSYSGLNSSSVSQRQQERTQTFSEHPQYANVRPRQSRSSTNPNIIGTSGPYGLGFTYADVSNYHQMEQAPQSSMAINTQPIIDFHRYRRNSSHLAGPPIAYHQYPSANFTTPQMAQFSPGLVSQSFQPAYSQQHTQGRHQGQDRQQRGLQQAQQSYTLTPDQPRQFVSLGGSSIDQNADFGDNSDGGVPIQPGF